MTTLAPQSSHDQAVDLLRELGLKQYEAKSFVALTRLPQATARQISDILEVPRTRVYDVVVVLESFGLVEAQDSTPKQFRAVPIEEAIETLKQSYDERFESLEQHLKALGPADVSTDEGPTEKVWALTGGEAITSRTEQLIDEADEELVLILGDDSLFGERLVETLEAASQREVTVIVGTISEELQAHVRDVMPEVDVFVSELSWLRSGRFRMMTPRSGGCSCEIERHSLWARSSRRQSRGATTNRLSSDRGSTMD